MKNRDKKFNKFKNFYWRFFDTGSVKIHCENSFIKKIRIFGNFIRKNKIKSNNMLYFKINRESDYALPCIQEWINIAHEMNYDFCFICDNNKLKYDIIRKCYFYDGNIKFISSMRHKLKKVAANLGTKKWIFATYAHLTPFYHAKKNKIDNFWNIDADDTSILLYPNKVAQLLKNAEKIAIEKNIDGFSLDMWRSKTLKKHWSLGIFFVKKGEKFIETFESINNMDWTEELKKFDRNFNVDWFLTYVKNNEILSMETFYPDKTMFIHWGNFINNVSGCWVNYWDNDKVYYPLMNSIYHNKTTYCITIGDCIKIDINSTLEDSYNYFENEIPICRFFSDIGRNTNNLNDFCTNSKFDVKIR